MNKPKFDSRLTVKLTPQMREKLDELIVRTGARDVAEMVRDALRVYDIITVDVRVDGNQILSRDTKSGEVSHLTLWPKAA